MIKTETLEEFWLDPRLAADTIVVGDLPLCRLLLMRNAHYPWFILVPRRGGVTEMHALTAIDRNRLMEESAALAMAMERAFAPRVMNVGKLGNIVPQLHLHHVARSPGDPCWPGPVWGQPAQAVHDRRGAAALIAQLLHHLEPVP